MRTVKILALIFNLFLLSGTATGDAETAAVKHKLLTGLVEAQSEPEGREAEGKVWQFWFNQAPTTEVREIFDELAFEFVEVGSKVLLKELELFFGCISAKWRLFR